MGTYGKGVSWRNLQNDYSLQMKKLQGCVLSLEEELSSMKHQNKSLQLIVGDSISKHALDQLTKRHRVYIYIYMYILIK